MEPPKFQQGSARVPRSIRVPPARVPPGCTWVRQGSTTRVPPGFHQGSTRVPPGFCQGSTGFYQSSTQFHQVPPGFHPGSSRVPPGFIRVHPGSSRLPPGFHPGSSRVPPQFHQASTSVPPVLHQALEGLRLGSTSVHQRSTRVRTGCYLVLQGEVP